MYVYPQDEKLAYTYSMISVAMVTSVFGLNTLLNKFINLIFYSIVCRMHQSKFKVKYFLKYKIKLFNDRYDIHHRDMTLTEKLDLLALINDKQIYKFKR